MQNDPLAWLDQRPTWSERTFPVAQVPESSPSWARVIIVVANIVLHADIALRAAYDLHKMGLRFSKSPCCRYLAVRHPRNQHWIGYYEVGMCCKCAQTYIIKEDPHGTATDDEA